MAFPFGANKKFTSHPMCTSTPPLPPSHNWFPSPSCPSCDSPDFAPGVPQDLNPGGATSLLLPADGELYVPMGI
ncbi:hypothetical protein PoB_003008100 [Plakobranchus ocellatus]|uniref:Uncharacterized protein n=1 Tax=Plakobranchus ocellatus TaxID=259542 RepID=A0AAV4A5P4_9GAST|nr:hypothetical protein PoB_003008100 [Plakobranchus ocellatus]